jgi:superfamily I DNA/RNA helicase
MTQTWWVGEDDLKEEQTTVLSLDFDQNLLILGPPGSGKTNLLLLRANHLHIAEKAEFYIVTYTSLLANFIKTGARQYSFPTNKIITQTKLYETVLGDHGINVPRLSGEDFEARKIALRKKIQQLMDSGKGRHSFPMLFIDEAQDYDQFDLSVFFYLGKSVCFSADARQGLYEGEDALNWLIKQCQKVIRLKYHFRTGRKIIALADRIMRDKLGHEPMLDTCQYKEDKLPSTVDVAEGIPLADQIAQTAERLLLQLKAYPNQMLGVLVPRQSELPIVWASLKTHGGLDGKITNAHALDFDPKLPVWVSTIHSAKGLEFRSVHLLDSEKTANFNAHARRLAFTAVTRAKTALIIYHEKELLPFFAAALATKNDKKIVLKDLFGPNK